MKVPKSPLAGLDSGLVKLGRKRQQIFISSYREEKFYMHSEFSIISLRRKLVKTQRHRQKCAAKLRKWKYVVLVWTCLTKAECRFGFCKDDNIFNNLQKKTRENAEAQKKRGKTKKIKVVLDVWSCLLYQRRMQIWILQNNFQGDNIFNYLPKNESSSCLDLSYQTYLITSRISQKIHENTEAECRFGFCKTIFKVTTKPSSTLFDLTGEFSGRWLLQSLLFVDKS